MKRLKKPVLFLLLLEVLAIAGNLLNIEIFVGVNFLFSSVFVFIVIHYFGVRWGVLVSFLSALPTILLWGTPYGLVTLVIEAFFVGYMYHNHKKNLILWDMLFASIIAIPLSIFTSKLLLDLDWSNTIFIMLKQSVNMIFNVLIANFLLILIESIRNKRNQKKFSVQELLFNLLMIFFLFPLLGSLIYIGNSEYIKVKDKIDVAMEQAHNKIYIGLTTNIQKYSNQLQNSKLGLQNASALYNDENVMQTKEVIDFAQKYTVFKKVYAFNYSSPNEKIYLEVSDTAYKSFPVKGELNPYFRDILYLDVSSLRNHYVTDVIHYNNKELMSIIVPVTTGDAITNIVGYTGAVFPIVYLRKDLKELDDFTTDDINYQITDQNGRKIYFSKQYEDQNENVIPLQYGSDEDVITLQEWTNKIYTKTFETPDNIPWDITVQVPVKPYKNNLYQTYINLFIFVFIFSGIALLFSYYLSFHLQKMLTRVASVTTNLPDKISSNQHIEWPVVGIREISNIIHNFKNTENKLRKMIVELLKVQTDLEYLAHFDPLTNVYNRNYFIDKFKDFVFYADDKDEMALLFIDLDRFKIINDMLGHLEGDTVLKGVAERLMNVCKEENVIGRLGGDEFIILVPKIRHMDDVLILAQNIINTLSLPYKLKGGEYYITASVGISVFPQDGDDIQTLIKNADIAMYSAKERGKNNYQFFDDAIKEKLFRKFKLNKN
ncbi:GGDEF domain-containing protein [Bacillus coahuilensis]|uniref:GGDEF domain-containing protein n=1 Tax=Bacillus coahuilensis TaxID=408580 RepID=UPI0007503755|nr:GGDEF domain-containing protein [Bacillus coahuilensis]